MLTRAVTRHQQQTLTLTVRNVANKRPFLFSVVGGLLRPFDSDTESRVCRFSDGSLVKCINLVQPRSIPFQGYYWATMSNIVDATECAPTADHLHDSLVKLAGFRTAITDINGRVVDVVRDSTAFDSMDEVEFSQYVKSAQKVLAEQLGIVWDDYTK